MLLMSFSQRLPVTSWPELPSSAGSDLEKHTEEFCVAKGFTVDSFSFAAEREDTVLKVLKTIERDKASGLDTLPAKFITYGAVEIADPLTHIIDMSRLHSSVPEELKSARAVPLHKKNSKT